MLDRAMTTKEKVNNNRLTFENPQNKLKILQT